MGMIGFSSGGDLDLAVVTKEGTGGKRSIQLSVRNYHLYLWSRSSVLVLAMLEISCRAPAVFVSPLYPSVFVSADGSF